MAGIKMKKKRINGSEGGGNSSGVGDGGEKGTAGGRKQEKDERRQVEESTWNKVLLIQETIDSFVKSLSHFRT